MVMYDSSKATGFGEIDPDTLEGPDDGYTAFLDCMEDAQLLAADETLEETAVADAEHECTKASYRNTAMASFFFFDHEEAEGENEDHLVPTFLDAYMKEMKWLRAPEVTADFV